MRDDEFKVELTFMPIAVDGSWTCTRGEFAGTLADWLALHQIHVDDDCQFCRIVRFDKHHKYVYEYRAYTAMQVRVTCYIINLTY